MYTVALIAQYAAIALLVFELVYTVFQKTSKTQLLVVLMTVSALFMMIGYIIEIQATTLGVAMLGAKIGYLGKPFILLTSLLFVAHYCGYSVSDKATAGLIIIHAVITVLVFTNESHHLFYATVGFDRARTYSPLVLTQGPFYFVYMAIFIVYFIANIGLAIREWGRAISREDRWRVLIVFSTIFAGLSGYAFFLTGLTHGYDSTMLGCSVGTLLLSILFKRYRLFDMLTAVKDDSLDNASYGLLVLNNRGALIYENNIVDRLIAEGLSVDSVFLGDVSSPVLHIADRVYAVSKKVIEEHGRSYGKTLEIVDITDSYHYASRLEQAVAERTQEINHIQRTIIASLATLVDARDDSTGAHIKRTGDYVHRIARNLRARGEYVDILTDEYISRLVDVAPLHDIGKVVIPDKILLKPARLTAEEFDIIKTHTTHGARIVEETMRGVETDEYVTLAKNIALYHHEKWDGSGYPQGLTGADIPLCARIMAVADVYDAVCSKRCYKEAVGTEEAARVLREGMGKHFDALCVEAFLAD